ncbi:MAG: response regulator [Bacteroidota bacterium]|nr:response regulator [Bacteroidota bacterium]MDP4251374.1 response regulator [Bacteroidota bacterium]
MGLKKAPLNPFLEPGMKFSAWCATLPLPLGVSSKFPSYVRRILLADDDEDDCLLFKEALEELSISASLTIVHNGEQLIQWLIENEQIPDVLFLDLNMPRKNGFACLSEIKQIAKLKDLPVIILSTSFDQNTINLLHKNGARHYFKKPNEFSQLKILIEKAIRATTLENSVQPTQSSFGLSNDPMQHEES